MDKHGLGTLFRNIGKGIVFIFSRVAILYAVIISLSVNMIDFRNILDHARAEELNEIMPSFVYLDSYDENQGPFDAEYLKSYIRYYERVNKFLPHQADVLSLLGYCYYYKKDTSKSISYYKKAIKTNSHIFWFYYNLGVIYYKQKDFSKAAKYLQQAIDKRPEHALMFAGYSRSFRRIAHGATNYKEALQQRVQEGYAQAFALLVLANYQRKDYLQSYSVASYAMQMTSQNKDFFLFYAGMSTFKMKEYNKAAYFLKEYLKVQPNDREALVHMALSFKELGAEPLAEVAMKKAILTKEDSGRPILTDNQITLKLF